MDFLFTYPNHNPAYNILKDHKTESDALMFTRILKYVAKVQLKKQEIETLFEGKIIKKYVVLSDKRILGPVTIDKY